MSETVTTWATPWPFFKALDTEFNFSIDVCALKETAKVSRFYSPDDDGLSQNWSNETIWMNPPYGRGQNVYAWVEKAFHAAREGKSTCVCLLPASIDTRWFHNFVMNSSEIRFVKDRIWFEFDGVPGRANHASMIVIFRHSDASRPIISSMPNYQMAA